MWRGSEKGWGGRQKNHILRGINNTKRWRGTDGEGNKERDREEEDRDNDVGVMGRNDTLTEVRNTEWMKEREEGKDEFLNIYI